MSTTCPNTGTQPIIDALSSRNIPVVAAAGNDGSNFGVSWPACLRNVVKVAATNDVAPIGLSAYSNIDSSINQVGAIYLSFGDTILSAYPRSRWANSQGTSMAAPHVTGYSAYLKHRFPGITIPNMGAWIASSGSINIFVSRGTVSEFFQSPVVYPY